jgi:phosphopantetheine--protein transferase-like protein
METRELLRKTVAEFFGVDVDQVGPNFLLTGPVVQSSIDRAALASRIRHRVGLNLKAIFSATRYEELEAELIPDAARGGQTARTTSTDRSGRVPTRRAMTAFPEPGGRRAYCGVDMELIEKFPSVADYWEDPFYSACFTPAEIAYCLTQEAPALHFAARWCAKEALKKCDPDLLSEEMRNLEVASGDSQEPSLHHHVDGEVRRLPHSVSLSHTPLAAIAIVIRVGTEAARPVLSPTTADRASDARPGPGVSPLPAPSKFPGILQTLFALVAFCLAVLALLRTYHPG